MTKELVNQASKLAVSAKSKIPVGGAEQFLAAGLKELVSAWQEFKKVEAVEVTKRHQIEAWRQTQLAKIQAQESLVSAYMNATFKERNELFVDAFARLDHALDSLSKNPGDITAVTAVDKMLVLIVNQVQASPLAGLNDILRSMEDDTGTVHI